jgi:NitT/TauT family transport system substrate-binding protein
VPALLLVCGQAHAQEKLKISYSSVDAPNANWYIAENKGIYQKYGLDVDLVFIPTSTTNVATLVADSIKVGNISGGSIANAVVGGANLVAVGCFINTLPYELIVHESIRTPQQLKGKSVGISRIGSSSDVAARVLLKGLGLEPEKDVAILQVGGSGERAAAFATGKIAAFPSPPGTIHLTKGMASRTLITTADFPKSYPFPYVCPTTPKSYLSSQSRHRQAVADGIDRGNPLFQKPQGREQEDPRQVFTPIERSLSGKRVPDHR